MKILPVIFLLLFLFCSCGKKNEHHGAMVFRYNESKGITSLDPAFAKDQKLIWPVCQIFNGLVQMDDSLAVRPCIARRWEISPDNKVYTFYLRDDVYFHDNKVFPDGRGRRVTASDFEYSFSRITDPSVLSPGQWIFDKLEKNADHPLGFRALNDSVFTIWLKMPFPPFTGMLTMPYCFVVPREAIGFYGTEFSRNPVGTGPFSFALWREDEKLVLLKNASYFEKDSTGHQLPYLDAVNVTFIKDKQSEFLEFLKGNLDFLNSVHPAYKDVLLTPGGQLSPSFIEKLTMISGPFLNTEYLGFLVDTTIDIARQSPVTNINVRKAINYGFDRARMIKYMRNNLGKPALSGFIPDGLPAFDPELVKGYHYDPDSARYYLEKAGYKDGKGMPAIVLTTTSDYLDLCEFIQFELSKIGINIQIDVATGASFRNKVAGSNLVFFRGSWIADYPDAENYLSLFYSPNKSPAGPNYTHFSSEAFDRLYLRSLEERNPDSAKVLYNMMDRMIMDEAPVVLLYYDNVVRFTSKHLTGLGTNPMNLLILKNVKYRN